MSDKLSHKERLQTIMAGEKPDRPAASVWRHFFHKEIVIDELAGAMLDFQNEFDWDFMKINPRASFHVEDWGCELDWSTDEFQKHTKTKFAVKEINDWEKIEPLPSTSPVLADHLKAISMIRKGSDKNLPLLMTIFNPIGVARYLTGDTEMVKRHLREDKNKVLSALEIITVTFETYVRECLNAGADGIFFATLEWASSDTMTYDEYSEICRPYDLRILNAVKEAEFNMLHVCHSNNYLKNLLDYPVKLINWESANPTNTNFDSAVDLLDDKIAVAGLDDKGWLWHSDPTEVGHEINRLKEKLENKRYILGPGCAIDPKIPYDNLRALRDNL